MKLTAEQLAKKIDHTLVRPEAVEKDIEKICEEAKKYKFMSVVVSPCYIELAKGFLTGSAVKVGTVVGFPFGGSTPEAKAFEAHDAVLRGVDDIDMVINVGALKSGNLELIQDEIEGVVSASLKKRVIVKVIFETCYLDEEQKRAACLISERAGANFVKTSTGFGPEGATVEDVKLLRSCVSSRIGVKAAGGIRTYNTVLKMLKSGATRIGTSAGVKIMKEFEKVK